MQSEPREVLALEPWWGGGLGLGSGAAVSCCRAEGQQTCSWHGASGEPGFSAGSMHTGLPRPGALGGRCGGLLQDLREAGGGCPHCRTVCGEALGGGGGQPESSL